MKHLFFSAFLAVILINMVYQAKGVHFLQNATTVLVTGKILETETNKPVSAKIVFQKLPHGGAVGIIDNNPEDGSYELILDLESEYSLEIRGQGHGKKKVHIATGSADTMFVFHLSPVSDENVVRLETLTFAQGDYHVPDEAVQELNDLVDQMILNDRMEIQLEGHTDFRGNKKKNFELSEDRVKAVKDYLVSQGIKRRRIKTKAFGGTKPLTHKNTPEAHAHNRRVEVRVIKE